MSEIHEKRQPASKTKVRDSVYDRRYKKDGKCETKIAGKEKENKRERWRGRQREKDCLCVCACLTVVLLGVIGEGRKGCGGPGAWLALFPVSRSALALCQLPLSLPLSPRSGRCRRHTPLLLFQLQLRETHHRTLHRHTHSTIVKPDPVLRAPAVKPVSHVLQYNKNRGKKKKKQNKTCIK